MNTVLSHNDNQHVSQWRYLDILCFSMFLSTRSKTYLCETKLHACVSFTEYITLDSKFQKNFVSVMNMLLIYLFASMKLEKGHKKITWL